MNWIDRLGGQGHLPPIEGARVSLRGIQFVHRERPKQQKVENTAIALETNADEIKGGLTYVWNCIVSVCF